MERVFISPSRYVQGKDILFKSADYIKPLGIRIFLITDTFLYDCIGIPFKSYLEDQEFHVSLSKFNGEASIHEIERIVENAKNESITTVIALGGGKLLDTGKAVAMKMNVPVVICPTLASTDAPTSSISVIYSEEGVFEQYMFYSKNPDLVLVDSRIISKAPVRMLISGISDALATFIEGRAVARGNGKNMAGAKPTIAGQAIASACETTLFTYALQAVEANKSQIVTPALEAVIEANTLLSGLGFEDAGLAATHSIHNGFTALKGEIHTLTHGEKVAYGALVQLVLEGASEEEFTRYAKLYLQLGLPTTLEEIHLLHVTDEELYEVAKRALSEGETIHNMPFQITEDDIVQAIRGVDAYIKEVKRRTGQMSIQHF